MRKTSSRHVSVLVGFVLVALVGVDAASDQLSKRTLKRERANLEAQAAPGSLGSHFITLSPNLTMVAADSKTFRSTCGYLNPFPGPMTGHVGWGQAEVGWLGQNCFAFVLEIAVRFDTRVLDGIPFKRIERAELLFDEVQGANCPLVLGYEYRCWQNGDGKPEQKANGCVEVHVPSFDWTSAGGSGLVPYLGGTPTTQRISRGRWDVTEEARRQVGHLPVALGLTPGHGFLLSGALSLGQLTAQDNAVCVSAVSNVRLAVTYFVEPAGSGPVVR